MVQSACLDIDASRFYKASKVKGHGGYGHFGLTIAISLMHLDMEELQPAM